MDEQAAKKICLALIKADTEDEVVSILQQAGLWDDGNSWRYYGGYENNYNTIGNQQSRPEAALVEKIINAVDARLMNEALVRGIDPEGENAPTSVREAVAEFFDENLKKGSKTAGLVREWPDSKRTEVARGIAVFTTGKMPREGYPCVNIVDYGEGQAPDDFDETFLSLTRSNKVRIPFVQGKYNMGGTGVLKFCGTRNLQLLVSRRNPDIADREKHEKDSCKWGYTIVRREDPSGGRRNSVYTYLAPVASALGNGRGVLRFESDSLALFPEGKKPYSRRTSWGTLVKLYEYKVTGFKTNILRKGGLLSRLDLMLPQVALPVRLHECRSGYRGHEGSFETTLAGLSVRLDDDKAENLEFNPTSTKLRIHGETFTVTVYGFKKGKRETYARNEGVIFILNGQTHGHLSSDLFRRTFVGMDYLADSILVTVDCGELSGRAREDLFMTSRDRLSGGDFPEAIEEEIEKLVKEHPELRALRERRRREDVEALTAEDKPLEDLLEQLLSRSPGLSRLLLAGGQISDPFKHVKVRGTREYKGRRFPTYFRFEGEDYGNVLRRGCHINQRFRVTFETDAENEYFSREVARGDFALEHEKKGSRAKVEDYVLNLVNGIATLTVDLPRDCAVGEQLTYVCEVTDPSRPDPFANRFTLTVEKEVESRPGSSKRRQPPGTAEGDQREAPDHLALPKIVRVKEENWGRQEPPFDRHTALRIKHAGTEDENGKEKQVYDFYVNVDNIHLKVEQKRSRLDSRLVEARFVYGLVIIGLAMIRGEGEPAPHAEVNGENGIADEGESIREDKSGVRLARDVEKFSRTAASVLLPVIESLSSLDPGEIEGLSEEVKEE